MELAVPFSRKSDPRRYIREDRLPYKLLSYKGRRLDLSKRVQVYRNLRGVGGPFSIRQGGFIVAHGEALMLQDARFHVNERGRQRVLATGRKNVHAWISGYLIGSGCGTSLDEQGLGFRISYNPFRGSHFSSSSGSPVRRAMTVMVTKEKVTAAYCD